MISSLQSVSQRTFVSLLAMIAVLASLAAKDTHAAILNVPSQFPTIQSAIDAGANGDEIVVATGIYPGALNLQGKRLVVRSVSGPVSTIIDMSATGGSACRAESGEPLGTSIQGFTFRGATASTLIVGPGSNLHVKNCRIMDATTALAAGGSGARISGGAADFEQCEFSNLHVIHDSIDYPAIGGAISMTSDASASVVGCSFANCSVSNSRTEGHNQSTTTRSAGGAIYAASSDLVVRDSTFQNCRAFAARTLVIINGVPQSSSGAGTVMAEGGAIHLEAGSSALLERVTAGTTQACNAKTQTERMGGTYLSTYCSTNELRRTSSRGGILSVTGASSIRLDECVLVGGIAMGGVGLYKWNDEPNWREFPTQLVEVGGGCVFLDATTGSSLPTVNSSTISNGQVVVQPYAINNFAAGFESSCIQSTIRGAAVFARLGTTGLFVHASTVQYCGSAALLLLGGTGATLENCLFRGCSPNAVWADANAALITGCRFQDGAGNPIRSSNSGSGVTIGNSYFCNNTPNTIDGAWINAGGNEFSAACVTDDCNSNGIDDSFEIQSGAADDCNQNAVPDACDIASASSEDCDDNEVPDECQFLAENRASPPLSPVQSGTTLAYSFTNLPPAGTDVTVTLDANADLSSATETIQVRSGSTVIGTLFQSGGLDCTLVTGEIQIPQEQFNQLRSKSGSLSLQLIPSFAVTAGTCTSSSVTIRIEYQPVADGDCNGNSIPDVCDVLYGKSADSNSNLIPDECEELAACVGDVNNDGDVSAADLSLLLAAWNSSAADLDGDGTTAASDLSLLLANWGACP